MLGACPHKFMHSHVSEFRATETGTMTHRGVASRVTDPAAECGFTANYVTQYKQSAAITKSLSDMNT